MSARRTNGTPVALALALGACTAAGPTASLDGALLDAGDAAAILDTGPAGDAGSCSPAMLEATCSFRTATRQCEIACDLPTDCGFRAHVHWTDGFCCDPIDDGEGDEDYVDCRCENGLARCYPQYVPPLAPRTIPRTTCECFPASDAGADAGTSDAGI
ncbi:MAG: hypothetical protein U0234_06270 [Sandaracinus sp.]